jgi:basic amino acid/polyamine antiporter, APA family
MLRGEALMKTRANHLVRVLGLAFGLAAVVGSVVGQGILRSPGIVAQSSGSPAVLIGLWAAGAALAMLAALPYAELGAAIPRAGGPIAFAERAFGRRMVVVTAFTLVLMNLSSIALLAYVTAEFLVRLGVGAEFGPGAIATILLALFFVSNAIGTRLSGAIQVTLSSLKGVVLIALVIALFAQPGAPPADPLLPVANAGWYGFGAALLVIFSAYSGWGDVVNYGEDITDPGRAIPRALFGGILGIATLYLAVNLALLYALSPAELARSSFAAADAARGLFGDNGDRVFTFFGVFSVGAITNLALMTSSRVVFATAREGILPGWFMQVTRRGTPLRALGLTTVASMAFLWSDAYIALIATSVALAQGVFVLVALAAIKLRKSEPDMPRPFAMPFFPLTGYLVLGFDLLLLAVFVAQDPFYSLLGLVLVAGLSAAYLLLARTGESALAGITEPPPAG